MAAQRVTPFHRKVRNSGTERMSRAMISLAGTGAREGAAGVKTAKLCAEQDQIGRLFKCGQHEASGSDRKEKISNDFSRGMIAD